MNALFGEDLIVPIIGGRAHNLAEIQAIGQLGYSYAEISLDEPEQVEADLGQLLGLKEEYGITYLAHFPNEGNPLNLANLTGNFLPKMNRLFQLSAGLGIAKGTFHFWIDGRRIAADVVRQKIELIADLTASAKRLGIVLCLENLSETCNDFLPAFERVPDLMMTLDIGHAELLTKVNTSFGFISDCFSRIAHLHVHDNRGGTSVKDDLHLPLGEGIVDYPGILTRLQKKAYASTITMEVKIPEMAGTRDEIMKYMDH
ncbi:MAG: sugar phosphate isomerase/epimerase [Deltaproteobacteria bacterium]|nr:sugar phosphate isomerase/epimerase [Deltaproteobacteria bacterium]